MTRLTSIKQTTQYTNNKERTQLFILSTECQFCSPFVCRQHDQSQTSGTDTLNHKIPKSWRSQSFNTPNRIHSQIKVLMSRENMYGAIIIVDMVSCWMLLLHHHRIELFIHLWLPPPIYSLLSFTSWVRIQHYFLWFFVRWNVWFSLPLFSSPDFISFYSFSWKIASN